MRADYFSRTFRFNFDARTSRGRMKDKVSWFVRLSNSHGTTGIGECGPLPGLSPDAIPEFEDVLAGILRKINSSGDLDLESIPKLVAPQFPSIVFGLETALLDLKGGGKRVIFDNSFVKGMAIPINGLVWMGEQDFMKEQISAKLRQGFRCLKLKIGGLDFEQECAILEWIRAQFSAGELVIRLDANGAFTPLNAMDRLTKLSSYEIHSIEQPVMPGEPVMRELCDASPIPIALDEELIGVYFTEHKEDLLAHLRPAFIILKPTLHGGFAGCAEWIAQAESRGIGWWITSALESGIGLNAVCQFTAEYAVKTYQGLGTGMIFKNNFTTPLHVSEGKISYDPNGSWKEEEFL